MLGNNATYRYETPYNNQFLITHWWINSKVILKCGATKSSHNIHHIKPYTYYTNAEGIKC